MNGEMYAGISVIIQVWEDGLLRHIPIFLLFILSYRKIYRTHLANYKSVALLYDLIIPRFGDSQALGVRDQDTKIFTQ